MDIVNEIKLSNYNVCYISCDNAGENLSIKQEMIKRRMFGVKIEYTTPYTPQFNGVVE